MVSERVLGVPEQVLAVKERNGPFDGRFLGHGMQKQ